MRCSRQSTSAGRSVRRCRRAGTAAASRKQCLSDSGRPGARRRVPTTQVPRATAVSSASATAASSSGVTSSTLRRIRARPGPAGAARRAAAGSCPACGAPGAAASTTTGAQDAPVSACAARTRVALPVPVSPWSRSAVRSRAQRVTVRETEFQAGSVPARPGSGQGPAAPSCARDPWRIPVREPAPGPGASAGRSVKASSSRYPAAPAELSTCRQRIMTLSPPVSRTSLRVRGACPNSAAASCSSRWSSPVSLAEAAVLASTRSWPRQSTGRSP